MMNNDLLKSKIELCAEKVNDLLSQTLGKKDDKFAVLFDSCNYSLLAGGKRIRPFLVCEFYKLFSGNGEVSNGAYDLAKAVEMIHTYSLIHDDLPCMDNDDMRRGRPSNHKAFSETTALLAGDALLTYAFETISSSPYLSDSQKADATLILSKRAGIRGMVGGQQIAILSEDHPQDYETLLYMNSLKTGALIEAACLLGVCAANIKYSDSTDEYRIAAKYAKGIGIVFQLVDDILDITSTTEELGKPVNSDKENQKTTFMTFFSIDKAKEIADKLTEESKCAIKDLKNSECLSDFADYLKDRKK